MTGGPAAGVSASQSATLVKEARATVKKERGQRLALGTGLGDFGHRSDKRASEHSLD